MIYCLQKKGEKYTMNNERFFDENSYLINTSQDIFDEDSKDEDPQETDLDVDNDE